jgi:hypothetical protein
MRLRAGLILFLFIALVVGGCRKPLAPTFDSNLAPETWITAAPLDTITTRESGTNRPIPPTPGVIPFAYHLYWAGSDNDGKVSGFYFAVTETSSVPTPGFNTPPPLPGPKAHDYHYTTKTDSVFVFSVSQDRVDRAHAFYIYAVDNQGKPDPTPARFIFTAIDRYPPLPVIDSFTATGYVWLQDPGYPNSLALTRVLKSFALTPNDTFAIGIPARALVPSGSKLVAHWHAEITTPGNPALGFAYKLDEPSFIPVPTTVDSVIYNSGPNDKVGPGQKIFRLRAIDKAGGKNETTRHFNMNLPPYAWYAGPDRNASIWTRSGNDRFINVANWGAGFPNLVGVSLFSTDSVKILPSQRTPRKTFLEFWGDPRSNPIINRVYCRQENDTVHMNSWVVMHGGGFDADSPYNVIYRVNDPNAPDSTTNPVLQIRTPNGSPVGFRTRLPVNLWPNGPITSPSQSGLFPVFDPASVFRSPTITSFSGMIQSGVVYFVLRAEDGDGQIDSRIGSRPDLQPEPIVRACDSTAYGYGPPTPEQLELRPMILKFFVDFAPAFPTLTSGSFHPRPGETYLTRVLNIAMPATDSDPYVPGSRPNTPGGCSNTDLFRYTMKLRSPRNGGAPGDSVTFLSSSFNKVLTPPSNLTLPDSLGGTQVRVMVELCDCPECELVPGQGRCAAYSYLINVPAPPPPPPGPTTSSSLLINGPGSAAVEARRRGER